jgi:hypothetical protein
MCLMDAGAWVRRSLASHDPGLLRKAVTGLVLLVRGANESVDVVVVLDVRC